MIPENWLLLAIGGLVSGILAGFLGIGGGTILVPFLVALTYDPILAVATSSLAILITSISGSIQNWRMGLFDLQRVLALGLPAIVTAQLGVYLANLTKSVPYLLLAAFGLLLLLNIYLIDLRQRLTARVEVTSLHTGSQGRTGGQALLAKLGTGGAAGILAGLFGVGGGVIMVPLQILLLAEPIKVAIQTSLGVIMITAIAACVGHFLSGNILVVEGILLGVGGLIGVQISTRILPRLPDQLITVIFRTFLGVLSIYIFWQSWKSYTNLHPS